MSSSKDSYFITWYNVECFDAIWCSTWHNIRVLFFERFQNLVVSHSFTSFHVTNGQIEDWHENLVKTTKLTFANGDCCKVFKDHELRVKKACMNYMKNLWINTHLKLVRSAPLNDEHKLQSDFRSRCFAGNLWLAISASN